MKFISEVGIVLGGNTSHDSTVGKFLDKPDHVLTDSTQGLIFVSVLRSDGSGGLRPRP